MAKILDEVESARRMDRVNAKLREYNWLFIHPYNQGYEINYLEGLLNENVHNIEQIIFERSAGRFLDIELTITILEGFYKKRPFMKSFGAQIEESIVLCLQKDFAGAIMLLIPVIEGTIRNYLISRKGESGGKAVNMSDLAKAFYHMGEDYAERQMVCFYERHSDREEAFGGLDKNQLKQLRAANKEYFTLWIKQLEDYLIQNLYFNTKNTVDLPDNFNRHNIFHGFEAGEYSFKNFLRLLSCLNFLSWAIGMVEPNCSIFPDVDDSDVLSKWKAYFKLLIVSESMDELKSEILGVRKESFKKYTEDSLFKPLVFSEVIITNVLKANDIYFRKRTKK